MRILQRLALNRFHVAVHLVGNISQNVKKKKGHTSLETSVLLMSLPHFDVTCDLLLNGHTATLNLFVLFSKEVKKLTVTPFMLLSSIRS